MSTQSENETQCHHKHTASNENYNRHPAHPGYILSNLKS